jgi:probable HAF family extracellular repeat protein
MATPYPFIKIDSPTDPTFNQLLAINDSGVIAGYYGAGTSPTLPPNRGYTVSPGYGPGSFHSENYPLDVQTQVTGINNAGLTVGFEIDAGGDSYGFIDDNDKFSIAVPELVVVGGHVNEQFLGVNDLDQIAGFTQTDSAGDDEGFIYDADTGAVRLVNIAKATSVSATDINDRGQISGFATIGGKVEGFFQSGTTTTLLTGETGWSNINALGLNDNGQVVGSFQLANGSTEGFLYNVATAAYTVIKDPNSTALTTGTSETVVNGINDAGQMVGFYKDSLGNTNGMLIDPAPPTTYTPVLQTLDNPGRPVFNQLLGINNAGEIVGYDGANQQGFPNKGYSLTIQSGKAVYQGENYPGSLQTQVTGINNAGLTVGFETDAAGNSAGFVDNNGRFTLAVDPNAPAVNGVLTENFGGVNDLGQVAGFYAADANGDDQGFVYDSKSGTFTDLNFNDPGITSVTATDVNDKGWISGFMTQNGSTMGFIDENGKLLTLSGQTIAALAHASDVQVLGLNNVGMAVGSYVVGNNNTEGFIYDMANGNLTTVVDPNAVKPSLGNSMTVLNGINDLNQIVGFYQDSTGNTNGLLVTNGPAGALALSSSATASHGSSATLTHADGAQLAWGISSHGF